MQQHHTDRTTADKALEVVILANHLAHLHGAKPFEWATTPPLPDGILERLGLDAEAMQRLQERKQSVEQKTKALLDAAQG